ncbi:MAG: peptidylprolyl isomerase, partial [Actinomycetota bacterium]
CGGTKPPRGNTDPRPAPALSLNRSKTYTATVETSCGAITVELADDERPQTVNSFVSLARSGFYDGLTFHRVKGDFVVQGGDPAGNGTGGPGYNVTEAPAAGTKYPRGTVAMAKGGVEPAGTFGSQFFFVSGAEGEALPPLYAMLGRVRDGIEVLDRVEAVPVEGERPLQTIYIVKISITES